MMGSQLMERVAGKEMLIGVDNGGGGGEVVLVVVSVDMLVQMASLGTTSDVC